MSAEENLLIAQTIPRNLAATRFAETVHLFDIGQNRMVHGRGAVQAVLNNFFVEAFDNVCVQSAASLADNETAVLEFVYQGRQRRLFMGIPATGRWVWISMALICRFRAGEVTQISLYYDAGTLLRQLGLASTRDSAVPNEPN